MQTVTPLDTAAAALRETSSDALLTTIEALTHRIHAVKAIRPIDTARLHELAVQREAVRREVLRRIGGTR